MGRIHLKPINRILLKFGLGIISMVILFFVVLYLIGPPPISDEQDTIYYDASGEKIGEGEGKENQDWVSLTNISPHVIDAMIAIEDQHFFKHHGFDIKRILIAALKDIKSGSLKEGASTLTQQYARNLYLSHEKTWSRKIKEAIYTIRLEMFYSKTEILEGYLNTIYYGAGAYGIEAASQVYFNKKAKDLTLAESAMLAGIPKGPSYFSPFLNKEKAEKRQQLILRVMHEEGVISKQTFELAKNEILDYAKYDPSLSSDTSNYFQETVLQEAKKILQMDREAIQAGGYRIYTTLEQDHQDKLEETIEKTIDSKSDIEIGALALDPNTGAIRALVGGRDFQKSPFNRATHSRRMTGSTFKPILFYAALERGFTANTTLMSKPTTFEFANNNTYQPRNYNGYYANDPITLAQALALSDNIYAVKTHLFIGMDTLVETAKKFGITGDLPRVPSLALGTASVPLQEMVTAYGMIGNGGMQIEEHTIEKIVDKNGKTLYTRGHPKRQIFDEKKTFILTELLTGMFDESLNGYMSVTGSPIIDQLSRPYAGKSGTTESDSWMIGYSPEIVTGIWTGYDDNRELERVREKKYAKEIWAKFMEKAHQDIPMSTFMPPKGVIGIPIDPETGKRATPNCPTNHVMYFEIGTEPTTYCKEHQAPEKEGEKKEGKEKGIFQKWFELFFD